MGTKGCGELSCISRRQKKGITVELGTSFQRFLGLWEGGGYHGREIQVTKCLEMGVEVQGPPIIMYFIFLFSSPSCWAVSEKEWGTRWAFSQFCFVLVKRGRIHSRNLNVMYG